MIRVFSIKGYTDFPLSVYITIIVLLSLSGDSTHDISNIRGWEASEIRMPGLRSNAPGTGLSPKLCERFRA